MATAVLPVWRSPMISSRWPRPIGTRASMILRPVCTGSCTDLRGMMPGALTSTRRRSATSVIGPLPSIGSPSGLTTPAEQALAHRHVDDLAQAADFVAFGDLGVGAEDHDADVVALEVQGHALHAGGGELDHFPGFDLIEAEHPGDAVADRQHLADVGDVRLDAEVGDLALEDVRDFGGANVHGELS